MQESKGKRALHPVQERHTQCDELSSYRSRHAGKPEPMNLYILKPKPYTLNYLSGLPVRIACQFCIDLSFILSLIAFWC